jgi:hypothetical protein
MFRNTTGYKLITEKRTAISHTVYPVYYTFNLTQIFKELVYFLHISVQFKIFL